MTDHLEPYRRLVRSIRFTPPLPQHPQPERRGILHLSALPNASPAPAPKAVVSEEKHFQGPTPDPSEHIQALVREAVSKPTVLPATYQIQENIGDRISHLATPKASTPIITLPKIPAPDPNWTPSTPIESQQSVAESHTAAPVPPVEVATATTVESEETSAAAPPPLDIDATVAAPEAEAETQTPVAIPEREAIATVTESQAVEETSAAAPPPLDIDVTVAIPEAEAETQTPVATPEREAIAAATEPQTVTEASPTSLELPVAAEPPDLLESVGDRLKNAADTLEQLVSPEVEPESVVSKTPSDTETHPITCPKCGSTQLRKNGRLKGKQKYTCKDCGRNFVEPHQVVDNEVEPTSAVSATTDEVPQSPGFAANAAKTSKAKSKKKPIKGSSRRKSR